MLAIGEFCIYFAFHAQKNSKQTKQDMWVWIPYLCVGFELRIRSNFTWILLFRLFFNLHVTGAVEPLKTRWAKVIIPSPILYTSNFLPEFSHVCQIILSNKGAAGRMINFTLQFEPIYMGLLSLVSIRTVLENSHLPLLLLCYSE